MGMMAEMRVTGIVVLAAALAAGAAGCATRVQISPAEQAAAAAAVAGGTWQPQVGTASWYGADFHGRTTANGEVYDMHAPTAAHKTLPFNTVVRVTHLTTGAATEVRINDRGPFVGERIIDLSMAAAGDLDMIRTGIAEVRIEVIRPGDPPAAAAGYVVQVASFRESGNARALRDRLRGAGFDAELQPSGGYTRVVIPGLDASSAAQVQQRLRERGFPEGLARPAGR